MLYLYFVLDYQKSFIGIFIPGVKSVCSFIKSVYILHDYSLRLSFPLGDYKLTFESILEVLLKFVKGSMCNLPIMSQNGCLLEVWFMVKSLYSRTL